MRLGRFFAVAACGVVCAGRVFGQVSETIYSNINPADRQTYNDPGNGFLNGVYTHFYSQGLSAGAGGGLLTAYVADDLLYDNRFRGAVITSYSFTIANTNTTAVSFRPIIRFWDDYGAASGGNSTPGDLFYSADLDAITLSSGEVRTITVTDSTPGFGALRLPDYANPAGPGQIGSAVRIWAGLAFDNNGGATGATAGQLNNLGSVLYSANPTVGSSGNVSATIDNTNANRVAFYNQRFINPQGTDPEGYFMTGGSSYTANFGWQFTGVTVPEPGTLGFLLVGGISVSLGVVRRTRRSSHSTPQ